MAEEVGGIHLKVELDIKELAKSVDDVKRQLSSFSATTQRTANEAERSLRGLVTRVDAFFTLRTVAQFAQSVINVRGEMQNLEVAFTTMAGRKMGEKLFKDIKDFAVKTPLQLRDLANSAKTLLSFNVDSNQIMPILKSIGDISGGSAEKMRSLSLAFAQMSSTGRLMGQDLLQMINAGFNPLAEISRTTGKSMQDLKEDMERGAISVEMVTNAFFSATQEGGRFHGLLEQQAQGMVGAMSNLRGAWDDMLNSIGEDTQGLYVGGIEFATNLIKNYEKFGKAIASVILAVGTLKASLIMADLVGGGSASKLAQGLKNIKAQITALNKTITANPWIAIATAIMAVLPYAYSYFKGLKSISKEQEIINKAEHDFKVELASQQAELDRLFGNLKKVKKGTKEYEEARTAITSKYGEYLANQRAEIRNLQDQAGAYELIKKKILEVAQAKAKEDAINKVTHEFASNKANIAKKIQDFVKNGTDNASKEEIEQLYKIAMQYVQGNEVSKEDLDKLKKVVYTTYMQNSSFGTYKEIKSNILGAIANFGYKDQYKKIKKQYDDAIDDINLIFSDTDTTEESKKTKKVDVKNKKYYTDLKDKAQRELDALSDVEVKGAKGAELRKKISEYNAIIASYDVKDDKLKKGKDEVDSDYKTKFAQAIQQGEEQLTQEKVNAMSNGLGKILAQNEVNYNKQKKAIEEKERELKETAIKAFEQELKEQKVEVPTDLKFEDLPKDKIDKVTKVIKGLQDQALENFNASNRKAQEDALNDFLTYEQKRIKIIDDFNAKRDELYTTDENGNKTLREGVTEDNVGVLEQQQKQALGALDQYFLSKNEEFQDYITSISEYTYEKLEEELTTAEALLDSIVNLEGHEKEVVILRGKIDVLKKALKQVKPNEANIAPWKKMRNELSSVGASLNKIGDAIGGLGGKAFKASALIFNSVVTMIDTIANYATNVTQTIEGVSKATAIAIKSAETASVILTIISIAFEIASAIYNMFSNNEEQEARLAEVDKRVEYYKKLSNDITLFNLTKKVNNFNNAMLNATRSTELLGKALDALKYSDSKSIGLEQYSNINDQFDLMTKKLIELKSAEYELLDNVNGFHWTEKGYNEDFKKYEDNLQKQADAVKEYYEKVSKIIESIIGGTSEDIAGRLGDAFFTAFSKGEDALESWHKTAKEVVSDILKRLLIQEFISPQIASIVDDFKRQIFQNGRLIKAQRIKDLMPELLENFKGVYTGVREQINSLNEGLKTILQEESEGLREGQSGKGIASASQDSVDELNGRFTAIQMHTHSIMQGVGVLVDNSNNIFMSVSNIDRNVEVFRKDFNDFQKDIKEVKSDISQMKQGVKIKD